MKELMDNYNNTLDFKRFAAIRDLLLHKKIKNLYMKNRGFHSQNRKLKEKLKHFKDEVAQKNLNVLVEVAIEREEPIVNKSTPTVKKTTPTK
jgi:hypothetical protein